MGTRSGGGRGGEGRRIDGTCCSSPGCCPLCGVRKLPEGGVLTASGDFGVKSK
jgi:hypothetical protein